MKHKELLYLIILILHLFLSYSVFLLFENQDIILLTKEDGFFESLGAIFFLIASIFFFIIFWKDRSGNDFQFFKTKRNIFFLLLGLVFFVGFGEEISWGQRIFNFHTPEILKEHNLQDEVSIHNLGIFQVRTAEGQRKSNWALLLHVNVHFILFWFAYCIIIPILNRFNLTISEWFKKINLPMVPIWIGIFFLANLIVSRMIGVRISGDIHSLVEISGDILNALMEIEECNFAFLFLLVSLYLFQNNGNKELSQK